MTNINFKRLNAMPATSKKGDLLYVKNRYGSYDHYLVEENNKPVKVGADEIVTVADIAELETTTKDSSKLYIVLNAEYNNNGVGRATYRVVNNSYVLVSQVMKTKDSLAYIYVTERDK